MGMTPREYQWLASRTLIDRPDFEITELKRQLAEAQAAHRALYDAAVAFIDTPGQISQSGGEDAAYAALVQCVLVGQPAAPRSADITTA